MRRLPVGVSVIATLYFLGSAAYAVLLFGWLFARASLVSFIEEATPSASLAPALLLDVPGLVTSYFAVMAVLCCWIAIALHRLQRWAWFVSYGFAVFSFVLDIGLFAHMFHYLPMTLAVLGLLRFALLAWIVAYLSRTSIRAAFGLSRAGAARA